MKKWTSLFLALVLMLSCMSIPALAEDKPVITIWMPEDLRIENWDTNYETLWLEEKLGVDLQFILQPSADYSTKVNMALTVGAIEDLPDVITGKDFGDANVWEWAQAETIIPLTEYYNNPELAVEINKAIERTGVNYPQQIQSPDGNIYALASFNQSYGNEYPAKMWIYQPWLDELGLEYPKTTEEFYQMLKKVKETDLNGNGKNDEIPLCGSALGESYSWYMEYVMNAFAYMGDEHYRHVQDGVVTASYATDAWKEGLKYIKKLFDEGLILAESLTMTNEQFKSLTGAEEQVVFAFAYFGPNQGMSDQTRVHGYYGINPIVGPEGVQYASYEPSVAKPRFMITANCKDPELAFKLGDLLQSEHIGVVERWGAEGKDWDYAASLKNPEEFVPAVEGWPLYMVAYDDGNFWGGTALTNGSWRQKGPFVRQYAIANGSGKGADVPPDSNVVCLWPAAIRYQNGGWQPEEVIPKLIYTSDESDAISEIESNLLSYVHESLAKFVTGAKDIDAEWDNYLAELDKIGLETYLEVVQNVYDRMYK